MIFLCSALYHGGEREWEWVNPTNYISQVPLPTWLQIGSANGRHWWETGAWEERRSQGVSSLLFALGSIFGSMAISLLWFQLPLPAPACMVQVPPCRLPCWFSLLNFLLWPTYKLVTGSSNVERDALPAPAVTVIPGEVPNVRVKKPSWMTSSEMIRLSENHFLKALHLLYDTIIF